MRRCFHLANKSKRGRGVVAFVTHNVLGTPDNPILRDVLYVQEREKKTKINTTPKNTRVCNIITAAKEVKGGGSCVHTSMFCSKTMHANDNHFTDSLCRSDSSQNTLCAMHTTTMHRNILMYLCFCPG